MIFKCLKDTSTIQLFERKRLKIGQIFSFDRLKKVLFLIFESFGDINYFIVKLLRIDSIGILGLCWLQVDAQGLGTLTSTGDFTFF